MVRSVAGNLPEQVKNNQSVNTAARNGGQKMSQYSWFTVYANSGMDAPIDWNLQQNYPSPLRVGVIHYNSYAIFDRLEFFTPRCQLCKLFFGHIFTCSVLRQEFKISVNIQPMCFCHLNHCVGHCTGIRSANGIAEQPVFAPYCKWTDRILRR